MPIGWGCRCVALVAILIAPSRALASDWVWESDAIEDRASANVRFSTRFGLWFSTFDRPPRACEPLPFQVRARGLDATLGFAQTSPRPPPPGDFCPSAGSEELGLGAGIEIAFRVVRPIYVTVGLDIVYTTPDIARLKNQVIIPVPFGVLLTIYEWPVRPIVHGTIMPVLYVTDDARDYTLGADFGFAWRVLDWGDLAITLGYKKADTMSGVQLQIALHPVP